MSVAVDASAVGAFLLPDERDALADFAMQCCARETVVVPRIWRTELAHLVLRARRRGRLDDDVYAIVLRDAHILADAVTVGADTPVARIVTLAQLTGLSAYDASYAALAQDSGLPLLTRDGALARAARDLRIDLLQP